MPRPPSSTLFPYTTLFRSYLSTKIVPVTDRGLRGIRNIVGHHDGCQVFTVLLFPGDLFPRRAGAGVRSEEHTSELQSRPHLVCRLLLEKKKQRKSFLPKYL